MPTATRDRIVIHAHECGANALGFVFTDESWLGATGALIPPELGGFYFARIIYQTSTPVTPLRGEEYPALVHVWDNDSDAIYDAI